jgi:hypothetical protein
MNAISSVLGSQGKKAEDEGGAAKEFLGVQSWNDST